MTSTAATRISHDQQPGRSDMDEHQRGEHLRTAYRAADQEWRPVNGAANSPSPEDLAAACDRARDAALAALTEAGLDGDEALALARRAARQQDDESEVPVHYASRYPARVGSISWHLLADGYTITWAPAPAGCSLTLNRHGPRGEHAAYRGSGPTMQRAWDEVRAQLGNGEPQPTASATRKAPGPARGQRPPVPRRAVLRPLAVPERLPDPARQQQPQAGGDVPDARAGQAAARACQRPCEVPALQRRGLVSVRRHRRAADR
jgi:hypothetical protein